MKVMLIGANGQLGSDLCIALRDHDLVPLTDSEIDITDISSVSGMCDRYKPQVVINTAAYVLVDDCEDNIDLAFRVNALGARNVAVAAEETGAALVQISSDYVFGGGEQRNRPYTEFDTPVPVNVYGKSKLAGERYVQHLCTRYFIIRASALFGVAGSMGKGGNFVETVIKMARNTDQLRIVSDQVFSPTYAKDLAGKMAQLLTTKYYGIFHITNEGACSWYDFTVEILRLAGAKTQVTPILSKEYPQKAKRPAYSVLGNYQLELMGMADMRGWKEALRDYLSAKGHIAS